MAYILKIFKCTHCHGLFVIMETIRNKLLPINVSKNENISSDEIFDSSKRRCHFKDCGKRADDWGKIKKIYEFNDVRRYNLLGGEKKGDFMFDEAQKDIEQTNNAFPED